MPEGNAVDALVTLRDILIELQQVKDEHEDQLLEALYAVHDGQFSALTTHYAHAIIDRLNTTDDQVLLRSFTKELIEEGWITEDE